MKKADIDRMVEDMTTNRMRHRTKELAEQAGFVLWPDGQGPFGEVIDWASSYDMELERFAELVRADKREWIGLDHEQMRNTPIEFNRGALWAERYLKERNYK